MEKPRRLFAAEVMGHNGRMTIFCLFGRHRPSLSSIQRRGSGYSGICESCARPLERQQDSRWTASEPLDAARQGA